MTGYLGLLFIMTVLGSAASLFLKKAFGHDKITEYLFDSSCIEYHCSAKTGLFSGTAAYLHYIYLNYADILCSFEREDYKKEDSWRNADLSWCSLYFCLM